jgi:biotin-(acetyl-CoA carboxylase) ligase
MERWTFDSQSTDRPLNGRPDNLYQPVQSDGGRRGRNWEGHTRASSAYTRAALHPRAAAAMIAALALGLGAAAVRHRAASSSGN